MVYGDAHNGAFSQCYPAPWLIDRLVLTMKQNLCSRCEHSRNDGLNCELFPVSLGSDAVRKLQVKPCNTERFLTAFVTTYVRIYFSDHFTTRTSDLVQEIILKLLEKVESDTIFSSPGEMRQYLAITARHHIIDVFRRERGQYQCGYCRYYQSGICTREYSVEHRPHTWFHKEIGYKQQPNFLDPPCSSFQSKRLGEEHCEDQKSESFAVDEADSPLQILEHQEKQSVIRRILTDLAERSFKQAYVIRRLYFEKATLEQIAAELNLSVRTVSREKQRALALLKGKLSRLGYGVANS